MSGYPPAPWDLHGSMWVSLFWLPRAGRGVDGVRPAGLYGAAWVDYVEPSPLTYRELLVARPVRAGVLPRVRITDIWVDSPASRDGGRALWAIPKGLARFEGGEPSGPVAAVAQSGPIAARDVRLRGRPGPCVPVRFSSDQPAVAETDGPRVTSVAGRARPRPARLRWDIDPDGPLAWLRAARLITSVRLEDFALRFG